MVSPELNTSADEAKRRGVEISIDGRIGMELISGPGSMMGYGYENVTEIFTDIGIRAPLLLIGNNAAFDARAEAFMEEHRKYMERLDAVARTSFVLPEDEDLPFG